jgi:lysine 2,3-aminomutase
MKNSKIIKSLTELRSRAGISEQELAKLKEVSKQFAFQVTNTVVDMLDASDPNDPIKRQFFPRLEELAEDHQELADPIGDNVYEAVKGLVHRYPDRCLLKVVNICPVYCRFCFRKEMIGPGKISLTELEIEAALNYIENHKEIGEVILTGGDPFILKPSKLASLLQALSSIHHVEVVRIHTRVPVVAPEKVNLKLVQALKLKKAVYVILHANHPKELTDEAVTACARLIDAGIPMLSQTVLLKGVNDNEEALSLLMKMFVKNRIKPFHLHHPDMVKGTSHFRLSIEEGQRLMKFLQGRFSGLCQPTYMLDIPGGFGKMPIGPCYLTQQNTGEWLIEDYLGRLHGYSTS